MTLFLRSNFTKTLASCKLTIMSTYPTLEAVEQASHHQLAYWYRFLPSPGYRYAGTSEFEAKLEEECKIQNRILERFQEFGGWNPTLSKFIGWGR